MSTIRRYLPISNRQRHLTRIHIAHQHYTLKRNRRTRKQQQRTSRHKHQVRNNGIIRKRPIDRTHITTLRLRRTLANINSSLMNRTVRMKRTLNPRIKIPNRSSLIINNKLSHRKANPRKLNMRLLDQRSTRIHKGGHQITPNRSHRRNKKKDNRNSSSNIITLNLHPKSRIHMRQPMLHTL